MTRAEPDASLTWRTGDDPPPEEWPALYAAGATIAEIAARTGHLEVRVRKALLAAGVKMRPKCPRKAKWHGEAEALQARGYSFAAIGRELGKSTNAVQVALLRRKRAAAAPGPIDPPLSYPVRSMADDQP